ncbi:hypothetical protein [Verrucosispora sp. NA02020]|uniref:hypothetical protein n=1 Tax=Verrucosispora sp. NA02020 TaxID=2742132 RepID=UPI003D746FCB
MSDTNSTTEVHALPYQDAAQRAIDALTSGQETFTRTQVAYLLGLALQMGIDATEPSGDDPALWHLAYETGYADGVEDGHDDAIAGVWEGLRFAFSGPRRKPDHRNGIRGNLTAADALWWHNRAVDQRAARQTIDHRPATGDEYTGGPVDWETGRPIRNQFRSAA